MGLWAQGFSGHFLGKFHWVLRQISGSSVLFPISDSPSKMTSLAQAGLLSVKDVMLACCQITKQGALQCNSQDLFLGSQANNLVDCLCRKPPDNGGQVIQPLLGHISRDLLFFS